LIYSIICYAIVCTIAVFTKKIIFYFRLSGGFFSTFYCFILPCLMYIKSNGLKKSHYINIITIVFACVMAIIGFLGGLFAIINEF